jgi:hypothetical protein
MFSSRTQIKNVGKDVGKKPSYIAGGNVIVQPLWKTVWRFLTKLKIELPYDQAIPLLGIYQKVGRSGYNKGICTPMFIAALFTIGKLWKQPRCPFIDTWINKMWYLYTVEFYSATKKNEML